MSYQRKNKTRIIILIIVLVIIILNLINYAINHDVINDYIHVYSEQKKHDDIVIQSHNNSIASHISSVEDNGSS